uniref:Uncharacterized protein n=1 Tax=Arundo donax TaxID=35708 RepID=A0A0A9C4M0_ARUDO
MASKLTSSIV